jgi:hypothetical protein
MLPFMRIDRLAVAAVALAITAAVALFVMLGARGPRRVLEANLPDPAASGRGALLFNPHCRNVPAPDFERAPNRALSGQFENGPYGYAVTIPSGLTAYTAPDKLTPGFGIVLSWQPRVYLKVDASYDVFYDITAAGVHRRDLQGLRLHDKLLDEQATPDSLGGEPAERDRMQFQCPGDPQIYLHDGFVVMRKREIYRLELQTVPARYAQDEALLNAMQRSWRWVSVTK